MSHHAESNVDRIRKPVVAAVDMNPLRATTVLLHGAELARTLGTSLEIMHAVTLPFGGTALTPYELGNEREEGAALVERYAEEAQRLAPDLTISTRLVVATASAALSSASESAAAMVLARRDTGVAERLLTGSTSSHLATRAMCPVLVAPAGSRPSDHGPVVVAVDGDSPSHGVLTFAFTLARLTGAELSVLHATPQGGIVSGRRGVGEVLAGWSQEYPEVEITSRVVESSTVDALTTLTRDARLLVLGRHRTSGAHLPWIRSVARAVLSRSSCAVVTVPHDEIDRSYKPPRRSFADDQVAAMTEFRPL